MQVGQGGNESTISALIEVVTDSQEDEDVCLRAIRTLLSSGDSAKTALLDALTAGRPMDDAFDMRRETPPEALRDIHFASDKPGSGLTALQGLQSGDKELRYYAANALGRRRDPSAIPDLIYALSDEEPEVRRAVVNALGRIQRAPAIPALLKSLHDENPDVRESVLHALGQGWIDCELVLPELLKALHEEDADARSAILLALRGTRDASVLPALADALNDSNVSVCEKAVVALGNIGGASVVPVLVQALESEDQEVRSQTIFSLGKTRDASAFPVLHRLRQAENREVYLHADYALKRLTYVLSDRQGKAQEDFAQLPHDIPTLIQALNDEDEEVLWQVEQALVAIGSEAVPALIRALMDTTESETVRTMVVAVLGRIPDASAVTSLRQALEDKRFVVRSNAASALGRIGDATVVPDLLNALRDEEWNVRNSAAWALGQIGDASAVPDLLRTLYDEDEETSVRQMAASALGKIGDLSAIPALLNVFEGTGMRWRWLHRSTFRALRQLREKAQRVTD